MGAILAKKRPSVVNGAVLVKKRPSVVMRAGVLRRVRSAQDGNTCVFSVFPGIGATPDDQSSTVKPPGSAEVRPDLPRRRRKPGLAASRLLTLAAAQKQQFAVFGHRQLTGRQFRAARSSGTTQRYARQITVQVEYSHSGRRGVGLQRSPEQHLIQAEQGGPGSRWTAPTSARCARRGAMLPGRAHSLSRPSPVAPPLGYGSPRFCGRSACG